MNKRIILVIVGVFLVGAVAGFLGVRLLWWQPRPLSPNGPLARELSLSTEQRERIASLNEPFFKHAVSLRQAINTKTEELARLLSQSSPDRTLIYEKLDEVTTLQNQLHRETLKHMLQVREELSEEQWIKFLTLLKRRLPAMFDPPRPEGKPIMPRRQ
jgi:Spy/CpxP family protein refolding chaperone